MQKLYTHVLCKVKHKNQMCLRLHKETENSKMCEPICKKDWKNPQSYKLKGWLTAERSWCNQNLEQVVRYMLAGVDQSYDLSYSSSTNWRTRTKRKQKRLCQSKLKHGEMEYSFCQGLLSKQIWQRGRKKRWVERACRSKNAWWNWITFARGWDSGQKKKFPVQ